MRYNGMILGMLPKAQQIINTWALMNIEAGIKLAMGDGNSVINIESVKSLNLATVSYLQLHGYRVSYIEHLNMTVIAWGYV